MMGHPDHFPHGSMRRKDREITSRPEIDGILTEGKVMHLALSDDNTPFLVPLFYAYDGSSVFFHSARVGTKIEILKKNSKVCFSVSLQEGVIQSDSACDFEAKHRTVIGVGTAHFIEDSAEKTAALDAIVARFTDKKFTFPPASLSHTAVIRIEIKSIKGKKHGYAT